MTTTNPSRCAVCKGTLERVVESRPAQDLDAAEEGRFQPFRDESVVVQIYCPRCQLLYRVVDPQDAS